MFSGPFELQSLFSLLNGTLKIHLDQKIDLTREYFRAIILHNFQCELSRQDCIDTHNSVYGNVEAMYFIQLCVVGAVPAL